MWLYIAEDGEDWLLLVPITERGDATGILESSCSVRPDDESVAYLESKSSSFALG